MLYCGTVTTPELLPLQLSSFRYITSVQFCQMGPNQTSSSMSHRDANLAYLRQGERFKCHQDNTSCQKDMAEADTGEWACRESRWRSCYSQTLAS